MKEYSPENFSLAAGGPLNRIFSKLGLLKQPLYLYKRRMVVVSLLVWMPLLLLSVLGGVAFGGVTLPFIDDFDVHVRFILVLPILFYAEIIAHDRFHVIIEQFLKCNIIASDTMPQFKQIIASTMRLRDSVLAELALIILVYSLGHWISTKYLPAGVSNWFSTGSHLTIAGYWYVFVSVPIFQFILLRWYFRIAVWYRFLWRVSRLPLQLNSLHPDRAGGLGFLATSVYALAPFLLAHSVLLAGMIFNRIWNAGATISDFQIEIVSILILMFIIPLLPLMFFIFQMINEKRMGTLNYDVVANRYVNEFRQKWITPIAKNSSSLLGTSDIQSLADLFNSFEVTNKMRITPFGKNTMMVLVVLTVLPLLPLMLTFIPLEKMVSQVFGIIF